MGGGQLASMYLRPLREVPDQRGRTSPIVGRRSSGTGRLSTRPMCQFTLTQRLCQTRRASRPVSASRPEAASASAKLSASPEGPATGRRTGGNFAPKGVHLNGTKRYDRTIDKGRGTAGPNPAAVLQAALFLGDPRD